MRLAELSERSGVPTATIKYYLREGLLRPGRRVSATQAAYDEGHLRRLRLVRALIQVGGVSVAAAREVIAAAEDTSLDHHMRLGAATWALPRVPAPEAGDEAAEAARGAVDGLLARLGWDPARVEVTASPAYRTLLDSVAALARLGYPCGTEHLLPYGRLAAELAVTDLDLVLAEPTADGQVEAAVALTVLYEPVLLSLRRLAHAEESARRLEGGDVGGQDDGSGPPELSRPTPAAGDRESGPSR
ncbi:MULTISPECIES: MerR family transcriptional regulator [Streptomyces]|uniref:MerR family transcriptional regulator n=1 Tax=Streptomyces TaxID=1883 RepID=UPI00163C5B9A|nr:MULTISPECIES: MerR family transcriptional regulator [Streptomyces]MBC2874639.1 MerR family transcriptional regulator [Streptomyces sp. TYQ1024]UBI36595.1 MerR family transcriptional regulator [Streptomyces mobaraensis]UKW29187.1 MerR family transcriptional regulator [Streptomyces sp. TYQ1024]